VAQGLAENFQNIHTVKRVTCASLLPWLVTYCGTWPHLVSRRIIRSSSIASRISTFWGRH